MELPNNSASVLMTANFFRSLGQWGHKGLQFLGFRCTVLPFLWKTYSSKYPELTSFVSRPAFDCRVRSAACPRGTVLLTKLYFSAVGAVLWSQCEVQYLRCGTCMEVLTLLICLRSWLLCHCSCGEVSCQHAALRVEGLAK